MLQGRLFSYGDAQRYRLGVNHNLIPVNRPKCPFHSYHRDGQMRTDDNLKPNPGLRAKQLRRMAGLPAPKEPPLDYTAPHTTTTNGIRRRLLHPARQAVAPYAAGRTDSRPAKTQQGRWKAALVYKAAPRKSLPQCRPRLWRQIGQSARHKP